MTEFKQEVITIELANLKAEAHARREHAWRYVQTLAVKVDQGTDLIYSFMKDGKLDNVKVPAVKETDVVPSITDDFIEAFVWENEIHDLWNITFEGIAIDFKGNFYSVAVDAPMTIISPEVQARREKQAKIEAAMAAKKAKDAAAKAEAAPKPAEAPKPEAPKPEEPKPTPEAPKPAEPKPAPEPPKAEEKPAEEANQPEAPAPTEAPKPEEPKPAPEPPKAEEKPAEEANPPEAPAPTEAPKPGEAPAPVEENEGKGE